jgi:PTH1 family peptidyl-tRNA hydrolase
MKIIIGLGNPGEKYQQNRHNVGFQLVDYLSQKLKIKSQKFNLKVKSEIIETENKDVLLVKPQTFMNESGLAVRKFIEYSRLRIEDLFVIHDDLDLPLGEYKIQFEKGPKLHNGVASIEERLGTKNFWRIRVGVNNRNPQNRIPGESYVLMNFSEEEKVILTKVFRQIQEAIVKQQIRN